jgi:hypothetical protein
MLSRSSSAIPSRQDPVPDRPREEKLEFLRKVEQWLGHDWLTAKSPNHPVKELWKRKDWLATSELLTLGEALALVGPTASDKTLREAANDVRSSDYGNRRGSVWEFFAASLLQTPSQSVAMAPAGHPGYDFELQLGDLYRIRFSCKALIESRWERDFMEFSQSLYKSLATAVAQRLICKPSPNPANSLIPHIISHEGGVFVVRGQPVRFDRRTPPGEAIA